MRLKPLMEKSLVIISGLFLLTLPSFADENRRNGQRSRRERAERYDNRDASRRYRYNEDYGYDRRYGYRDGRSGLPPGLAKRNGDLPPGLEKQLRRNGELPPGLEKSPGVTGRYDNGRRRGRR